MANRLTARKLAGRAIEQGEPIAWFDKLYKHAAGDSSIIPWADLRVNPNLTEWVDGQSESMTDRKCLVIGCGLGDDVEWLADRGGRVTGFDVSPIAIEWCKNRFPQSNANYIVADLFNPPDDWTQGFDFVFEAYTLQVFPPGSEYRRNAVSRVASFVAPGGKLLVVTRGRDEQDDAGDMPWPLCRAELTDFHCRLEETQFEDYVERETPPVRRFRIEYFMKPLSK